MGWTRTRNVTALTAVAVVITLSGGGMASASGGWALQSVPPPKANSELNGVSCTSPTACLAVGEAYKEAPLAYTWNGTSWTRSYPPKPPSVEGQFLAVSCFNAVRCMAAGDYINSGGLFVPFAEQRYGTGWKLQSVPMPSGASQGELRSVSCPTATWCMATGFDDTSAALTEVWNGTAWSVVSSPATSGQTTELDQVSCSSPSFCMAVGSSDTSSGFESSVIETWNGTSWTLVTDPPPLAGAGDGSALSGVSCPTATTCVIGGFTDSATNTIKAVVLGWNGTTWTQQKFPADRTVSRVSCATATSCTALGTSGSNSAGDPQIFHGNGTGWGLVTTPQPAGTGLLYALSCSRVNYCAAVGLYQGSSDHRINLPLVIAN